MKKFLSSFAALAFLLFATALHAQKLEKTLLWKVSGNGLKKPSYLYGTLHVACEVNLTNGTQEAIKQSEQLCLELDMDDESMQMKMIGLMGMNDQKTLRSLVSEEDFNILDAFMLKNLGASATVFNNMKPFVISSLLYPLMLDCQMMSVEGELVRIGKEQNKEVIGLETIEEQMAVFDAIPYEAQMKELLKTAKADLEKDKKELAEMMAVYASGDIDAMLHYTLNSDNAMMSGFENELLTTRNSNWISRIERIAKEKPTFFGVGAAHLSGSKGIIHLLRKSGFKVDPVLN